MKQTLIFIGGILVGVSAPMPNLLGALITLFGVMLALFAGAAEFICPRKEDE